jgi:hypothetical protein
VEENEMKVGKKNQKNNESGINPMMFGVGAVIVAIVIFIAKKKMML